MNFFRATPPVIRSLGATLYQIESAQLVRKVPEEQSAYLFKHALVQDGAYMSLTRHERKRLHLLVAETLERLNADTLDENAALLAHHFERAEEPRQTLAYLQRATDWARRSAAYREQAALLKRAINIVETTNQSQMLGALLAQRGQALLNVTEWREAQTDLQRALEHTASDDDAARAQILLDLAAAAQWLWNIAASLEYAQRALTLAEQMRDDTLAANAMTQIAVAQVSDGRPREGIETYQRAFARAREPKTLGLVRALEFFGLCLYWLGESENAVARSHAAIQHASAISDHVTIVRALSNLGAAQAARGEYGAALTSFGLARTHAEQNNIFPWLARALSMQSGMHLELFDYGGAEALMEEARLVARRAQFSATLVGSGIDLIFSSLRRGELVRADRFVREVEQGIHTIFGSHRWLWEIRFLQARAELALGRGQFDEALKFAEGAMAQSRSAGRRKYELLAQLTLAQARRAIQPHAALEDVRVAFAGAVTMDDPALILRAALARLEFERDEQTHAIARIARTRILNSLPESALRDRFLAVSAEWF